MAQCSLIDMPRILTSVSSRPLKVKAWERLCLHVPFDTFALGWLFVSTPRWSTWWSQTFYPRPWKTDALFYPSVFGRRWKGAAMRSRGGRTLGEESQLFVMSQRADYSIMVYFSNCLAIASSLMESPLTHQHVYKNTNNRNKSHIGFKMLCVNASFGGFRSDLVCSERMI